MTVCYACESPISLSLFTFPAILVSLLLFVVSFFVVQSMSILYSLGTSSTYRHVGTFFFPFVYFPTFFFNLSYDHQNKKKDEKRSNLQATESSKEDKNEKIMD